MDPPFHSLVPRDVAMFIIQMTYLATYWLHNQDLHEMHTCESWTHCWRMEPLFYHYQPTPRHLKCKEMFPFTGKQTSYLVTIHAICKFTQSLKKLGNKTCFKNFNLVFYQENTEWKHSLDNKTLPMQFRNKMCFKDFHNDTDDVKLPNWVDAS